MSGFYKANDENYKELASGVSFKTLSFGERTLLAEFRFEKGAVVPVHQHPHEQTGYLVNGRLDFGLGDEQTIIEAGDSWCIPSDVPHRATALEPSVVIEVFSPVREDYLP